MFQNGQFYQWMVEAVERGGTNRTLYTPDTTLSRRGVLDRAVRRSRELATLGIGAGDTVAVALGNVPEFLILLIALSKLGAVIRLIDPANGDRTLVEALRRRWVKAVIRRPRGMENAPLDYPEGYRLASRRRLSGTLISIDVLESQAPAPSPDDRLGDSELIIEAAGPDGIVRDLGRNAAALRDIGVAAASCLGLENVPRLLCSASLSVPRFFDPVILGWMATDCALVMAEDPSLKEALVLCRDHEPVIAVDSLRGFLELARQLRVVGSNRDLAPVVPQALLPVAVAAPLESVFGQPARQLLLLEEVGVLGSRLMRKGEIFQAAAGIGLFAGQAHDELHEVVAAADHSAAISPAQFAGQPGTFTSDGTRRHTGYLGKFARKGLLEVVRRADSLVNLEGRRACLLTVRDAILSHRRVTWAAPQLSHDDDGDPVLHVHYVATGETAVDDIEEHAVGRLSPYMVPRRFIRHPAPLDSGI